MSAVDDLLDLLESHLVVLTEMENDGVDPEDPRCDEWLVASGIVLTGIPYWGDLFTPDQKTRVLDLIKTHGGKRGEDN